MTPKTNEVDVNSPWVLFEDLNQISNLRLSETLFSQGNGFIGVRGTPEEGWELPGLSCEGVYLNGLFSKEPIPYGESAHGFATHNDKLLQVPNAKHIDFHLGEGTLTQEHERLLDMRTGVLHRRKVLQAASGELLLMRSERFVSAAQENLLCSRMQFTSLEGEVTLQLRPDCDDAYGAVTEPDDPRAGELSIKDTLKLVSVEQQDDFYRSVHSVEGVHTKVATTCIDLMLVDGQEGAFGIYNSVPRTLTIPAGSSATLTRLVLFHAHENLEALMQLSQTAINGFLDADFEALKQQHTQQISEFWDQAKLNISLTDSEQSNDMLQGLYFSMFQLYQSAGKNGTSAIAAKGLSGPGYDGHYFWDTEIYIIPFFALTKPDIAKQLLMYRFHTLDQAKERAKQMSYNKGALFSWRTISGEECSAYYPASTAQYHINSAVAYALRTYYRATGDKNFMLQFGAEILVESARLWPQLGHFNANKNNQFCIDGVTGPDEYTAIVDNNFYTNYMAKQHLLFALEIVELLQREESVSFKKLCEKLNLEDSEIAEWRKIVDAMYLPYNEKLNLHPQDDSFLNKKRWDLENQPEDKLPLLLHYHPLVIYRHQVLKQADVILAMFLGDADFSIEQKQGNLDYYEPLTTHDSTLSSCIHSMLYAEVGNLEKACQFFGDSARMDLDNLHHNTEYGVHTACMAGAWNCIVFGFLGLRLRSDGLHLNPRLPESWQKIGQVIHFQGERIEVELEQNRLSLRLLTNNPVAVHCQGQFVQLQPSETESIALGGVS